MIVNCEVSSTVCEREGFKDSVTDVTVTNPVAVAIEDAVAMLPVAVDLY